MSTITPTINQIAGGTAPMAVATVTASAPTTTAGAAPPPATWWQQELAGLKDEKRRLRQVDARKRAWQASAVKLADRILASGSPDRITTAAANPCPGRLAGDWPVFRRLARAITVMETVADVPRRDVIIDEILATERPMPAPDATPITIYEAFAGGGLLGLGIEGAVIAAGGEPRKVGYCERNDDAALAYETNNGLVGRDHDVTAITDGMDGGETTDNEDGLIRRVTASSGRVRDPLDILAGGPPCQDHSIVRGHIPVRDSERIDLYRNMIRLTEIMKPKVVIVENVAPAADNDIVRCAVRRLTAIGYRVSSAVIDAADFGTPQRRERFIVVGVRDDVAAHAFSFAAMRRAERTRRHTVVEVFRGCVEDPANPWTVGGAKHGLTGIQTRWIARNPGILLPWAIAPPRQRRTGKAWGKTYRRMASDAPSEPLTRYCGNPANGPYLHPDEERGISIEEALRLQGVPRWYRMPEALSEEAARLIAANGAPPQLGRAIIRQVFAQGILRA